MQLRLARGPEQAAQPQERHQRAPDVQEVPPAPAALAGGQLDAFLHRRQGDDVAPLPTRISNPSMIASVSGRRRATVVPPPGSVAMSIVPRRLSIVFLTTSMPTPRPDSAEIVAAVEKPGANRNGRSAGR